MNHLKRLDTIGNFGIDMITAAIGVLLLTRRYTGWTILYVMTVILSFGIPVFLIVSIRSGAKPAGRGDFLLILFNLIFGVSILQFPDRFMIWMHVFFGWWMIGRGILALIESHICRFDQLSGAAEKLLLGIISVLLGLFMIFGGDIPVKNQVLSLLAGVYFIVYGLLSFLFHLSVLLKAEYPKMRSVSFSMSILFSAFLPVRFYISIRQLKNSSRLEVHHAEPADLNVYIYIKGKGPEMFGHMDIGYQGTIWSYGNHDPKTRKLGGTYGDGVLIRADEKLFLQESITTDGKTVIAYGLKLSDEQKAI
ncbi:MAG: DUF308 domain-containing protein, partial [Solobacterium sp.]|nr:DUF308 domain-containing protein [Solobacterium sp.]